MNLIKGTLKAIIKENSEIDKNSENENKKAKIDIIEYFYLQDCLYNKLELLKRDLEEIIDSVYNGNPLGTHGDCKECSKL